MNQKSYENINYILYINFNEPGLRKVEKILFQFILLNVFFSLSKFRIIEMTVFERIIERIHYNIAALTATVK